MKKYGGAADMIDDMDIAGTPAKAVKQFKESCGKCGGSGIWRGGSYNGTCFGCQGLGYKMYATSPEARAKSSEFARKAKLNKADRYWAEYKEAHPSAAALLEAKAPTFGFAASLIEAVRKFGGLTEGQIKAVGNMLDREAKFKAERAEREASAPEVQEDKVGDALKRAKSQGLKYPKMVFAGFRFSLAGDRSKNPGAVYVKGSGEDGAYLGKVAQGRFFNSRDCDQEIANKVVEVLADPSAAARAYGQETGICCCCNRELTDPNSIAAGIGPVCAKRYGL